MFQPACWRTLPGSQPPKPPQQCFVCRPDQSVTLQLPYLVAGMCPCSQFTNSYCSSIAMRASTLVSLATGRHPFAAALTVGSMQKRDLYYGISFAMPPQVKTQCSHWRCRRCRC